MLGAGLRGLPDVLHRDSDLPAAARGKEDLLFAFKVRTVLSRPATINLFIRDMPRRSATMKRVDLVLEAHNTSDQIALARVNRD